MKKMQIAVLAFAVMLCGGAAFAQHGHGMGAGGSMNPAMGEGGSHRMSPKMSSSTRMTQQLANNKALARKIQALTKLSPDVACSGFKNLGQCVAAAHVSQNLGITFTCMKAAMTGLGTCSTSSATLSTKGMSLGKAIQTLSPTSNSKLESKKANKQAQDDLKSSSSS